MDTLCWLALPRESLGYAIFIGVQPQVQPMIGLAYLQESLDHTTLLGAHLQFSLCF